MYITVNVHEFREAFQRIGRANNFSYEGFGILFDYLEELEASSGESYELDVIWICCDFVEEDPLDIANDYSLDIGDVEECSADVRTIVRDYLERECRFVGQTSSGSIIYCQS